LINSIVKTYDGEFFVGTNHGLMTYDPYNDVLQPTKLDLSNKYEIINSSIESVLIDNNKNIWLGTSSKGLIKISKKMIFIQSKT
jgi:ligand-binding sensor domain-containing protein